MKRKKAQEKSKRGVSSVAIALTQATRGVFAINGFAYIINDTSVLRVQTEALVYDPGSAICVSNEYTESQVNELQTIIKNLKQRKAK